MTWKIVPYTKDRKYDWDFLISNSSNSTLIHFRDYMDYHQDRFKDSSIMLYKGNDVMAVFPADKKEDEIRSHGGLTFGSLLY